MRHLLTLLLFLALIAGLMPLAQGPLVTSNFSVNAPSFYVLGEKDNKYDMLLLNDVLSALKGFKFHLDEKEIILDVGDIHSIRILEEDGEVQKIGFYYSNSYMSESIYEVSGNKITPVSYRITASMGYGGVYLLIFAGSLIVAPLLSGLLIGQWNKRKKAI